MDYLYERRRRRKYRSPTSSRDDDDIEQEIIDRAMEIERSREKSLRRQFEYIVHNVKELERRRRHRTYSPEYHRRTIAPSHHRNYVRDSTSERYYQTNDSSYSEGRHQSSSKSKKFASCQITMIYRGNGNERHGDEIMILQENVIVFKGFLRARESFTFKFKQDPRRAVVKLEFFINELFECCLPIDCEQQQIEQDSELFQIQSLQISKRDDVNTEQQSVERSNHSRRYRYSRTSSSSTINDDRRPTEDHPRHQQKQKPLTTQFSKENKTVSKETSYKKQRSPSPPQSPPTRPVTKQSERPKSNSTPVPPSTTRQSNAKTTSTTDKKPSALPRINSTDDDDDKKQTNGTKPSYGPPQLSLFPQSSSSESSDDETPKTVKKEDEKPATETVTQSEPSSPKKDNEEEEAEGEEEGGGSGFAGFLQLLQAISGGGGGGASVSQSGDDGDGIQSLLTRLGIVTQNNNEKKAPSFAPHQVGNTENFLLVYLDSSPPDESNLVKLRGLVNSLKSFDDPDDCIAFINSISNEKVILLVSDALGDPVVSRIQDLPQLFAIYVFCETEEQAEGWSTNQPKIRAINTHVDEILQQIKRDIENDDENSLTWTYVFPTTKVKNEPGFVLNQIVKEALLDPDEMTDARKELVDFARNDYENNQEQLEYIQQFEDNYQKGAVLTFFQQKQFLFKMLNRAFRIPEVDVLFKLRLFIQNLHQLIVSSSSDSSIKTIYRSQLVTDEQLETFKKCTDESLIGFSHFFLASTERPEGKSKGSSTDNQSEQNEKEAGEEILFQIDVSNSNEYMLIENDQILVTFGLATRFGGIEKDRNGRTIIRLSTLNKDDRLVERVLEPIRKEIRAPHPSLRLVKLFIELDQYTQALYLGQLLISSLPSVKKDPQLALARTYHSLGTILYEKEDYDQALEVIKRSHELYLRFLPEDAPQLSPTWNNMGSIYLRQGKTDLALEHHERALAIQLKSPSPDLASIISYSNNIGGVYLKLERYDEALVHFKRALQIEEQTLPKNHPELAGTYHRIGGVYFRQNNHEQALEYYDKTLEIELASLPDNHPTVAVTYHNRGTALEGLGRLEEAVDSAEKAVERLLKTLPKEHPQVRMNQAYADRLKQKLWVKQLFT